MESILAFNAYTLSCSMVVRNVTQIKPRKLCRGCLYIADWDIDAILFICFYVAIWEEKGDDAGVQRENFGVYKGVL